ncbi:uncharacterized protein SRS1_16764 [Sporisorium reilianum f. sp. reilianum]|uniref:SH3 domain-containing protein n=1 Tax=Sporisorium reilianum f. sp. reilianum TaxID=72559 RepID=A0A2N8UNS4_9BASI|nr:uncharacterized protein SRS1_16764 [Sporisorium reilianum f. sp. reilianum]
MMSNLPAHEKHAFFGLLDEYFASRPHLLPRTGAAAVAPASAQRGVAGLTDRATTAAGNAAGAAASVAVSNALRDQLARTGITSKGPPPPAPSASKKPGFGVPAGLVSGKTMGSLHLGSRTTSSQQVPAASAPPAPAATRTLPPPTRTGASIPAPTPPAAPPTSTLPEGTIGTAQVLYDYGDGTDADDLQATEGEQIYLTERISDDWWRAISQDQARQGIIPTSYVRQL